MERAAWVLLGALCLAAAAAQPAAAPGPSSQVAVTVNATTFSNRDYVTVCASLCSRGALAAAHSPELTVQCCAQVSWSGVQSPGPADAVIAVQENQVLSATIPQRYKVHARLPVRGRCQPGKC